MTILTNTVTLPKTLALALVALGFGACASSPDERTTRDDDRGELMKPEEDTAAADLRAQPELAAERTTRICNISRTECHTRVVPMAGGGGDHPTSVAGVSCEPGSSRCVRVVIEAVGDGDIHWDAGQSLAGLTCSLDGDGLRMEWSDGFYLGKLNDCSNGKSYDFRYVRVRVLGD